MSWSLFICKTSQQFCLLISKSSHLKHVEMNCTWKSVFLHLYCREKTSFWALQTGYLIFKVNSSTPPIFSSTLNRVSTAAFTVSVLWRHFCEKVYHKSRVEKYFAGFRSWYLEKIELTLCSFCRWVKSDDQWKQTSLPEEYISSVSWSSYSL